MHTEAVKVPHWVRGRESLEIVGPIPQPLVMLGLGNSVGTPAARASKPISSSSAASRSSTPRATACKGRIVLFNVPFTTYGDTVRFRADGPVTRRRARRGGDARPRGRPGRAAHAAHRRADLRRRPAADSRRRASPPKTPRGCSAWSIAARTVRLKLMMEARFLPDADSANVVGEIRGRELPDEVVVIGGHFDSWDVGTGSTDDGGGCIATWEALRLMKKLNLRPRRTVRVVLWTNEENGGRGGTAYRDQHWRSSRNHVMMLESDGGVFRPTGFGFSGTEAGRARVRDIATLLAGIHADAIGPSGGGADIGPSVQQAGIPAHVARRWTATTS